jgi:hypothetical protein
MASAIRRSASGQERTRKEWKWTVDKAECVGGIAYGVVPAYCMCSGYRTFANADVKDYLTLANRILSASPDNPFRERNADAFDHHSTHDGLCSR